MSDTSHDEFLTNYYSSFIRTKSNSTNLFVPNASYKLSREQQPGTTFTCDYNQAVRNFHKGRIVRILIVTFDVITLNTTKSYLVIGQIKFDDGTMGRFVENMHLNEGGLVMASSVIVLDEEIVYGKSEFLNKFVTNVQLSVLVKDGAKFTYKAVIDNFGKYGKIVAFEKRDGDGLLEYETNEAINGIREMSNVLRDKGIHLVFNYAKGKY